MCPLAADSAFHRGLILIAGLLVAGCGGTVDYQEISHEEAMHAEEHGHEHVHKAPHGGQLIELGEHQYNAEVVFDTGAQQLVVYLLDAHAENPVAIADPEIVFLTEDKAEIKLPADPQEGDTAGKSSRFSAQGDALAALGGVDHDHVHGSVRVTIDGMAYEASIAEAHESHDDDHDHDDDHTPHGADHPH